MKRALLSISTVAFFIAANACSENGQPPGDGAGAGGTAGASGGRSGAGAGGAPTSGQGGSTAGTGGAAVTAGSAGTAPAAGTAGVGGATGGGSGAGGTTGGNAAGSGAAGGAGGAQGGAGGAGGNAGAAAGTAGTAGIVNSTDVTVQLGLPRQEIAGFGINNNWAPAMTDAEADAMFDPVEGLGLTILRIGMNPNGEPYNGEGCWSDITKAAARGADKFIGTLWSPPREMKTNNSVTGGGHLRPEFYEEWADTIAAFPAKVKQNTGIDLYGMSPQNETDFASCGFEEPCNGNYDTTIFTGAEYAAFIKIVGPKLKALNPPVKVIAPEASEWIHVWSNESGCCSEPGGLGSSDPLNCGFPATNCSGFDGYDYGHAMYADPQAWAAFDILGTHQYDTQVAHPWPEDVPDRKPVWQTEMSGVKWWPEQGPSTHIENGVAVAGWIHNALTVGEANAWLWWWWKALGDTNEGLLLANGTDTKRRYTFGNYSRFVRPGYTRVEVTGEIPENVLLSAFTGSDGTVVIVAVNKGTGAVTVPITIAGGTAPAMMTPHVTSASDNLAAKPAVAVTGGILMAALAGTTVTSFVGN